MKLGDQIKAKRNKERLSAEDLARKLGLKKENIYKWERGSTPSNPEEYKIVTDWLNNLEHSPKPLESSTTHDDTRELIKALREHNETLKNQVQSSLTALHAELRSNRELLVSLINGTTARGETIMEFLEELTRQQPGNLVARSDKREIDLQAKHNRKGNKAASDNDGKV